MRVQAIAVKARKWPAVNAHRSASSPPPTSPQPSSATADRASGYGRSLSPETSKQTNPMDAASCAAYAEASSAMLHRRAK